MVCDVIALFFFYLVQKLVVLMEFSNIAFAGCDENLVQKLVVLTRSNAVGRTMSRHGNFSRCDA